MNGNQYTQKSIEAINAAQALAGEYGNQELAQAHLLALEQPGSSIYNLGSGNGHSVKAVIDTVRRVTGKDFPVEYAQRRPGDPARLISDSTRARTMLGWKPAYEDLDEIVRSAWEWRLANPNGYKD